MFKPSMRSPYDVDECIQRLNTEKDNSGKTLPDRSPASALHTCVETQHGNSFTVACIHRRMGMRLLRYKGQIFENRENGGVFVGGEFRLGLILKLAFYAPILLLVSAELTSTFQLHRSLLHFGIYSVIGFLLCVVISGTSFLTLVQNVKRRIYQYLDSVLQTEICK